MTSVRTLAQAPARRRQRWLAGLARSAVLARLSGIATGRLVLHDRTVGAALVFGGATPGLDAEITVHDEAFYQSLALGGGLGAAEAFMDHAWNTPDLTAVVRLFVQNRVVLDGLERGLARLAAPLRRWLHARNRNDRAGSRRNIAAHYDLGDDLFALFLDETMTYSAAVFEAPVATLAEAQRAKLDRLCRKLGLSSGDHLLEIGTGWGAMAVHAAERYGCRVTSTTISRNQAAHARARAAAAGLEARVEIREDDYRDLGGQYDKLVSVEMVEAVGPEYLPGFFAHCSSLLRPNGVMAMQAITIADQHYARALRQVDFIKRYVFPGSFIPSTTALLQAMTKSTDLRLVHQEDLGPHYAETLRRWRTNFRANRAAILAAGYDERFLRLWEYYLAYCEGGFEERFLGVSQLVFAKPQWRGSLPLRVSDAQA